MLHAAAYVLIGYLSGMRDSEIKHLRRGCLRVERDPDGNPYRWTLRSLALKGETCRSGVPATWVVGQPAGRAITVIEALQPAETDLLFEHLSFGHAQRTTAGQAMTNPHTNTLLNDFAAWVNTYCRQQHRPDGIPTVSGRVWRLQTRQLRRTLAWFIARRPGGVIAGAIQYRHLSIPLFEGYAGTSASGFRDEVEAEQALSRGEHLMAMIDAHEHTDLAGPAAAEATRRLAEFAAAAASGFAGTVATDSHQLKRLIRRHDPAIYPGAYITCVYDHTKALCHATTSTSQAAPRLVACKPFQCRNVALTEQNTAAWRHEANRIDHRLTARPPLPPLIEHRLRQRHAEITKFLDNTTPPEGS